MGKLFDLSRLKFYYKGDNTAKKQEVVPFALNFKDETASFSIELANPNKDRHLNLPGQIRETLYKISFDKLEVEVLDPIERS